MSDSSSSMNIPSDGDSTQSKSTLNTSQEKDLFTQVESEILQLREKHKNKPSSKKLSPQKPQQQLVTSPNQQDQQQQQDAHSQSLSSSQSMLSSQSAAQAMMSLQAPYTKLIALGQSAADAKTTSAELVSKLISLHDLNVSRQSHINAVHSQLHGHHLVQSHANTLKIHNLTNKLTHVTQDLAHGKRALQYVGDLLERQQGDLCDMSERLKASESVLNSQQESIHSLGSHVDEHKREYAAQVREYDEALSRYDVKLTEQSLLVKRQQRLLSLVEQRRLRQDLVVDLTIVGAAVYMTDLSIIQKCNYLFSSNTTAFIEMLMQHQGSNKWDRYTLHKRSTYLAMMIRAVQIYFITRRLRTLAQQYGLHQKTGSLSSYLSWIAHSLTNNDESSVGGSDNTNTGSADKASSVDSVTPSSSYDNRSVLSVFLGATLSAAHALYSTVTSLANPSPQQLNPRTETEADTKSSRSGEVKPEDEDTNVKKDK